MISAPRSRHLCLHMNNPTHTRLAIPEETAATPDAGEACHAMAQRL